MSAFLGPIHHWLYKKILIQEKMTEAVLASLSLQEREKLTISLSDNFEKLPCDQLEDVIDNSNIHGWLQDKVNLVENRYVFIVSNVIGTKMKTVEELIKITNLFGKSLSKNYKAESLKDCFDILGDTLLDGMPCDHTNKVVSETENELTFKRTNNIHEEICNRYSLDPSIYYRLRTAFINGILSYTSFRLRQISDDSSQFYHNSITLMMSEHQYILRMVKVIRAACYGIMCDGEIDFDDMSKMISFIRNYADSHHHGKEEKILFKQMTDNLGRMGDNLIRHGMLVEHDFGRLFMKNLDEALLGVKGGDDESLLDVIANAISYTHLITRHIEKEDELVYSFGEKNLPAEVMEKVNKDTMDFEYQATKNNIQKFYIELLEKLEDKYLNVI